MRALKRLATVLCAALAAVAVLAAEKQQVCAKQGSGRSYKVGATVLKGQELNTATRTFNYTPYSTYVVIFWAENQASVIELDFPNLNAIGTSGKDQDGRKWDVSTSSICF